MKYCTACGTGVEDSARFCAQCGVATSVQTGAAGPGSGGFGAGRAGTTFTASATGSPRRLTRATRDKKLAGVCGGLAQYFGVDPTLMRLIWVGLFLAYGVGVLLYFVGWAVIPRDTDVVPLGG